MKKLFISLSLIFASVFYFSSCYDAIFQAIRNEVELDDATVTGFINGIVRFNPAGSSKQFLLVANGSIYLKDADTSSSGGWLNLSDYASTLGLPDKVSYSYYDGEFKGEHFFKMAADREWIYALSYAPYYNEDKSRNVPRDLYLYACKPGWSAEGGINLLANGGFHKVEVVNAAMKTYISLLESIGTYYNMDASIQLFCTNAVDPDHRRAYIRVGGSSPYNYSIYNDYYWLVYALNGNGDPDLLNCGTSLAVSPSGNEKYKKTLVGKDVLGAIWFGEGSSEENVVFTNYLNPITNESKVHHPTASYAYYGYEGEYLNSFNLENYKKAESECYVLYGGKRTYEAGTYNLIKLYLAGYSRADKVDDGNGGFKAGGYAGVGFPSQFITKTYMNTDSTICSLAVTNNSILMGTGSYRSSGDGIYRVTIGSDGTPALVTSSFDTNADSVMTEPYIVRSLLCVDPDKNELEAILYSSMDYIYTESTAGTSISDRGLWSYYPSTLEWNRE